ncbi:FMRF-amide neuropeptides-like isoform X3 [Dreissena polymorpha]|uniref:FMRF-amide neuropeptides-like isoform X3 n=1 Tax=Dreissena polymorpha TaxID=45954 RepID=UPI0022654728|nr:FMRF-amide neuropeptides-like isoform X3 [Dreissena polymorpha]
MGFLPRQLCVTLIFIVLIQCSQTFLRIGKRTLQEDSPLYDQLQKRQGFLRIGKAAPKRAEYLRFGRTFLRIGKRDEEKRFLRIGRGWLRIGKRDAEKRFLRIGRSGFLRIGRDPTEVNKFQYARGAGSALLTAYQNWDLTENEIRFVRQNRRLLLELLKKRPELGRELSDDSFYFPRMGRSGESTQFEDNDYCCAEGVRSVTTIGKGELEMCPRDQPCCSGMTEKTKLYKGTIITECVEDNSLEKMKAYLEDE